MSNKIASVLDQITDERRKVDFDSYDITVQQLCTMVANKQIDVAPTYQRRFRWDAERQSQLIESIFLGIPVPNLFMATNSDGTWEVVDGVQRLSSIVHYCGDEVARNELNLKENLVLAELGKLTALNDKRFSDLPPSVQLQFQLRPVKVTTLSDKSDLKVRFDLFERLNTGGVRLTDQEIRGCIYRGRFNDFLEKLALSSSFRTVVLIKDSNESDGTRDEFVLRYFAFLHRYRTFDHSVVEFLNGYMADATKAFNYEENEALFNKTFIELARILPGGLRRRQQVTPVNLFEAVAVGAAIAIKKRGRLKAGNLSWIESNDLKKLTTGATNSQKMVSSRIEFAAAKFGA